MNKKILKWIEKIGEDPFNFALILIIVALFLVVVIAPSVVQYLI